MKSNYFPNTKAHNTAKSLVHLVLQNAMSSSIDPQAIQQLYRARYPQMTNEQLNQATRAYIMQVIQTVNKPNQSSLPLPRSCNSFAGVPTGGEFISIGRGAKQSNFDSFLAVASRFSYLFWFPTAPNGNVN